MRQISEEVKQLAARLAALPRLATPRIRRFYCVREECYNRTTNLSEICDECEEESDSDAAHEDYRRTGHDR